MENMIMHKHKFLFPLFSLFSLVALPALAEETKPAAPAALEKKAEFVYTAKDNDYPMGDPKAPITIVEYASLSCPHCANAHREVLPKLQEEYIDKGKALFIFRHFPLDEPALRAAQVVECAGKDRYHRFLKVLFNMQDKWARDASFIQSIKNIVSVGGMSEADVDHCVADKALEDKLLVIRKEAQEQFGVSSTPTFFINGQKFEGEMSFDAFKSALDAVTAKK